MIQTNFSRKALFVIMIFTCILSHAQVNVDGVEPPFWWVGMERSHLQLMIKGSDLSDVAVSVKRKGVSVEKVTIGDSGNYAFIDLNISSDAKPGMIQITLSKSKETIKLSYELKAREQGRNAFAGLTSQDAVYLITPDRFANGDTTNDSHAALIEKANRSFHGGRHGGDLQGVLSKLDYIKELGATTVWLNPVLENNMPEYSYHGYAITDFYKVDPRYGSNALYKELADELHQHGMKLIMDMVFNHCGINHWWMKDKPFDDWIHTADTLMTTNYVFGTISDPYASAADRLRTEKGWFVPVMPDLNHDNPFMATYLIQNSIWWIEYAGLDGIRMDTYPYNQKDFMTAWINEVKKEYPDFYILGETWATEAGLLAYWSKQSKDETSFNSALDGFSDFRMCDAIQKAFKKEGKTRLLYDALAMDFLFENPALISVFADNHDMDRLYHVLGKDLAKLKLAMTYLLTTRGIPQIYYGTELLMAGAGEHGVLREDCAGGWIGDPKDKFTTQGRTNDENEAFDHIAKLLHWRKSSDAVENGRLVHFIPENEVYVYNRKSTSESVLVIINNENKEKHLNMDRYAEVTEGFIAGEDILTGARIEQLNMIHIKPNTSLVISLEKAAVN